METKGDDAAATAAPAARAAPAAPAASTAAAAAVATAAPAGLPPAKRMKSGNGLVGGSSSLSVTVPSLTLTIPRSAASAAFLPPPAKTPRCASVRGRTALHACLFEGGSLEDFARLIAANPSQVDQMEENG